MLNNTFVAKNLDKSGARSRIKCLRKMLTSRNSLCLETTTTTANWDTCSYAVTGLQDRCCQRIVGFLVFSRGTGLSHWIYQSFSMYVVDFLRYFFFSSLCFCLIATERAFYDLRTLITRLPFPLPYCGAKLCFIFQEIWENQLRFISLIHSHLFTSSVLFAQWLIHSVLILCSSSSIFLVILNYFYQDFLKLG